MFFPFQTIRSSVVNTESDLNACIINLTFPRTNLEVVRELGHGEFGKVLMAMAKGIVDEHETTTVAVKTLKGKTKF